MYRQKVSSSKFLLLLLVFCSVNQAFSLFCLKCETKVSDSACFSHPERVDWTCFSVNLLRNNVKLPILDSSVSQSQFSKGFFNLKGVLHNISSVNDDVENDCGTIYGYDIYRAVHAIRGCLDTRYSCDDYARAFKQQQGFTVLQCDRCGSEYCNTHILHS